jgi:hypothetical protein
MVDAVDRWIGWAVGSDSTRKELEAKPWYQRSPQEQVWLWRHPAQEGKPIAAHPMMASHTITVNVNGATEEGAKATAYEVERSIASVFERVNIQRGYVSTAK